MVDLRLIDSHAHLDAPEFAADREAVLRRAAEAGISFAINPSTDLASSRAALATSRNARALFDLPLAAEERAKGAA